MSAHIRFDNISSVLGSGNNQTRNKTTKPQKNLHVAQETKQPQENQNGGGSSAFVISNK